MNWYLVCGTGGIITALLHYCGILWLVLYIALVVTVICLGAWFGVTWTLVKGKPYTPTSPSRTVNPVTQLIDNLVKAAPRAGSEERGVVISRNTDSSLQEVINLISRDFILSWYTGLGDDHDKFIKLINKDTWQVIDEISERLSNIDWVNFCTFDVVNTLHDHFRDVRFASVKKKDGEVRPKFLLHPWLESEETEETFLRNLSEVLLMTMLPDYYSECKSIRHLLREILCLSVMKPTIDCISDPDYINQKIIGYIEYREELSENTRKTYTYAETYEDFVKMIDNLDIEDLKQIRYTIITEIMQATTISNLKKERGIETDKESVPRRNMKGDLLKSRNLKRYINQLTLTKARCEKRIHALGGPDYKSYMTDSAKHLLPDTFAPRKVLSFIDVMDSPQHREQFLKYLKRDAFDPLLRFWSAVEKLRDADKRVKHQHGSDIYHRFIACPTTVIKLDKSLMKRMEAFLLGNDGPAPFYEAQKLVLSELEEEHYPSFIVSDIYQHRQSSDTDLGDGLEEDVFTTKTLDSEADDDSVVISTQFHAQQTLEQLNERITNKSHALTALKSQKYDEKIKKVIDEMDRELVNMRMEKTELQSHIERTNVWCENMGSWNATIERYLETEDDGSPSFVILVHLDGRSSSATGSPATHGWVVSRSLADFHSLHTKLILIGSWLKKKELPSVNWFRSVNAAFMEKSKATLQDYLSTVLKDERMMNSEALYTFLSPIPDFLKEQTPEKRSRFTLANFFNHLNVGQSETDSVDLLFVEDNTREDQNKDSIAKPLYELIREIFELRGVFKLFRMSFIRFVEVTFGRSINRQLRETVNWLVSEPMVIYYVALLRDSFWPDGVLADPLPPRTDEQKLKTRLDAKKRFLNCLPDAVKTLVGEANARQGALKSFEVLQDIRLNKHLVYSVVQVLVKELLPELRRVQKNTTTAESSM